MGRGGPDAGRAGAGRRVHAEYRSAAAYLVEIDVTGPEPAPARARSAAVDVGLPINPNGLEAQMQGALDRRVVGDVPRGQPPRPTARRARAATATSCGRA